MTLIYTLLSLSLAATCIAAVLGIWIGFRIGAPVAGVAFDVAAWCTPSRRAMPLGSALVSLVASLCFGGTALACAVFAAGVVGATWLAPRALTVSPWVPPALVAAGSGIAAAVVTLNVPDALPSAVALLVAVPAILVPSVIRMSSWMRRDAELDESIAVDATSAPAAGTPRGVVASARTMGAAQAQTQKPAVTQLITDAELIMNGVKSRFVGQPMAVSKLRALLMPDAHAFFGAESIMPLCLVLVGPAGSGKRSLAFDLKRSMGLPEIACTSIQASDGLLNELVKSNWQDRTFLTLSGVAAHEPLRDWLGVSVLSGKSATFPHHQMGRVCFLLTLDIEEDMTAIEPNRRVEMVADRIGPRLANCAHLIPFAKPAPVDMAKIAARIVTQMAHRAGVASVKAIDPKLLVEIVKRGSAMPLKPSEGLVAASNQIVGRTFDRWRGCVEALEITLEGTPDAPVVMTKKAEFTVLRQAGV